MRTVATIAILVSVVLVGCDSSLGVTTSTVGMDAQLRILPPTTIEPNVVVPYNRQLVAVIGEPADETPVKCNWRLLSGNLPSGIQFDDSGRFSGAATIFGETGTFLVQAASGAQAVVTNFSFTVKDTVWVFPGTIDVDKFYPGARAEYTIKVHNDESLMSEQKKVTTDETDVPNTEGRITADIRIKQALHDRDITNVRPIKSSNPVDRLRVLSYDSENQTLKITGFLPLAERIISISYTADTLFNVFYEKVGDLDVGSMVQIAEPQFVLSPHETKEVLIVLEMPKDYKPTEKKFEFLIGTGRTLGSKGNLDVQAVNAVRWTVRYRDE